jgi:hypothetical protein
MRVVWYNKQLQDSVCKACCRFAMSCGVVVVNTIQQAAATFPFKKAGLVPEGFWYQACHFEWKCSCSLLGDTAFGHQWLICLNRFSWVAAVQALGCRWQITACGSWMVLLTYVCDVSPHV